MSAWESCLGSSNEWYTPAYLFEALGVDFDMDVSGASVGDDHVPTNHRIVLPRCGLTEVWTGFVWMNPPFGGRNGLVPWLDKFFTHGNGIALTPDRTSAPWWQEANRRADATLFIAGKVKFERPDGSVGKSPGTGTTLFAVGSRAIEAIIRADTRGLGASMVKVTS